MRKIHQSTLTIIALLLVVLTLPKQIHAQDESGIFGIGLTVTENTPAFMARLWVSPSFTIEPEFALTRFSRSGSFATNYITPGIGFIVHGRTDSDFQTLAGMRISFDIYKRGATQYSDLFVAPILGGEYHFSDNFSITGEYQLIVIWTDERNPPSGLPANSTILATGQLLSVQFRF